MRAGEGPSGFQGGPSSMGMRGGQGQGGDPQMQRARGGAPPMQPPPAPPAGMGLERGGQQGMGRVGGVLLKMSVWGTGDFFTWHLLNRGSEA